MGAEVLSAVDFLDHSLPLGDREQKCADTVGTVLVFWPFTMLKYNYIFQIKYTKAILSNSTRKLLWFAITKLLIAV